MFPQYRWLHSSSWRAARKSWMLKCCRDSLLARSPRGAAVLCYIVSTYIKDSILAIPAVTYIYDNNDNMFSVKLINMVVKIKK